MVGDERDFYDEWPETHECVGYCIYCKEEINSGDDVTYQGLLYHKDCFLLEHSEEEIG